MRQAVVGVIKVKASVTAEKLRRHHFSSDFDTIPTTILSTHSSPNLYVSVHVIVFNAFPSSPLADISVQKTAQEVKRSAASILHNGD